MRVNRHPSYQDLTGRVFGHLTVVSEIKAPAGNILWLCRCPNGKEVVRPGTALRASKNARCGRAQCACSTTDVRPERSARPLPAVAPTSAQQPPSPLLDVERNRERYVRIKLERRSVGLEVMPFAELTCAECPAAPRCEHAFKPFNVNGECLESK
jgi:hypothetical protein